MRAFLVHRGNMRTEAKDFLSSLRDSDGIYVEPVVLKNSHGDRWRKRAKSKISSAEVVIVYDSDACAKSENTEWEIEQAHTLEKPIIELSRADISRKKIDEIQSAYHLSGEFEQCFSDQNENSDQLLELYKIMVASSEQLVQRRQLTNGFFITVISAILGISGLVIREEVLTESTIFVLVFPLLIGLLMCRSWKNLIENYGKLNTGKFKVIHRIERALGARIFAAEWIALGKGIRKQKYQSFTSTEQNVPTLFSYLLLAALLLTLFSTDWQPWVESGASVMGLVGGEFGQ